MPRKQQGVQGRGGRGGQGLTTLPRTTRHSMRLSSQTMDSQKQVTVEMEEQETNPFHVLQMDEDEEPEDEEMEEKADEMQVVSPGWSGQRSPRHPAIK